MIRIADYIVQYLEEIGIRDVFTVSGGGSIFLCDALAQAKKLRYICCHHEQAVSMAAEGYARAGDGLGVSIVTTGPGGTNAVTGVAGAWMDSIPHLTISGQVFLNQTIGSSGLRQLGVQEINIVDIVRPITKYAVMVENPKMVKYHLQKAIHLAQTGRPGPVWIDIPANIQNFKINEADLVSFSPGEIETVKDPGLKEKVGQIVELLKNSKRPLLHIGQGLKFAEMVEPFLQFVNENQLPFVTARNANDLVETNHPLFVGRPGTFAQRGANFAVQNSDVYVAIGTRLNLAQTGYNSKDYARNAKKVMVDIDRTELEKTSLNIDIRVHAHARDFLEELFRQMQGVTIRVPEWLHQCQNWKEKYPVVLLEHREQKGSINSYYLVDILSDLLTPTDVVVTDMGIAFQGTHQAFRVKKGQRLFTNCGLAAMGWGLPAAIGASISDRKKRVICIAGEGGLQMNLQELATVAHHRLPIKLFILNNGGYMTIKQTQELGFEGRVMGCNEETGLSFPDYLKIAEAHGLKAIRLDQSSELAQSVQAVLSSEGPMICEIMMDPDQKQMPKAINRRNPDGSMAQTPLEDMYPFLDPAEIKENMIAERGTPPKGEGTK